MEQLTNFFQSDLGVKTLTVFITILVILLISTILKRVIPKYISATSSRYRARKFVNFLGYLLIIISVLIVFSNQLTGFTVFLGVAGAGIAFALQEVIASAAGFIVIHSSHFYKVGDRVHLGGIKGDVIDIGILRTSLMEIGEWVKGDLYNGRITRVANSFVFKEPVYNYSGNFPFLWDEIEVPIKTESDFEFAKEKFLEILNEIQGEYVEGAKKYWAKMTEEFMIENAKVEPNVSMVFDENWITFTLRYVVDYKSRRGTKDKISQEVLKVIKESKGKISIASSSFEITAFPQRS
jgi:small-conductance mechanosensitive channel